MRLDVIIPTKNRYSTLIPTVRAVLNHLYGCDFRLIIYDNSATPAPAELLELVEKNNQILYTAEKEDIDAVENFNRAIDQVSATYAILIGDDDFVLPTIFDAIDLMDKEALDCLVQPRATFYWPGVTFTKEFDFFSPASLQISNRINTEIQKFDAKNELKTVLTLGGIYLYNLPALYHGLVRSTLLKKIKMQHGNYVLGPSPDMSLALVLATHVNSYGMIGTPFSIAGASFNSAAGMGRRNEHSATLQSVPSWLPKDMAEHWDPRLPRLWNGFTVYAQSLYLTGLRACVDINLNYDALYKKMLCDNFRDFRFIKEVPGVRVGLKTILLAYLKSVFRTLLMHLPPFCLNYLIRQRPAFRYLAFYRHVSGPDECITLAMKHINGHLFKGGAVTTRPS